MMVLLKAGQCQAHNLTVGSQKHMMQSQACSQAASLRSLTTSGPPAHLVLKSSFPSFRPPKSLKAMRANERLAVRSQQTTRGVGGTDSFRMTIWFARSGFHR